jgi:hypothetical protein
VSAAKFGKAQACSPSLTRECSCTAPSVCRTPPITRCLLLDRDACTCLRGSVRRKTQARQLVGRLQSLLGSHPDSTSDLGRTGRALIVLALARAIISSTTNPIRRRVTARLAVSALDNHLHLCSYIASRASSTPSETRPDETTRPPEGPPRPFRSHRSKRCSAPRPCPPWRLRLAYARLRDTLTFISRSVLYECIVYLSEHCGRALNSCSLALGRPPYRALRQPRPTSFCSSATSAPARPARWLELAQRGSSVSDL